LRVLKAVLSSLLLDPRLNGTSVKVDTISPKQGDRNRSAVGNAWEDILAGGRLMFAVGKGPVQADQMAFEIDAIDIQANNTVPVRRHLLNEPDARPQPWWKRYTDLRQVIEGKRTDFQPPIRTQLSLVSAQAVAEEAESAGSQSAAATAASSGAKRKLNITDDTEKESNSSTKKQRAEVAPPSPSSEENESEEGPAAHEWALCVSADGQWEQWDPPSWYHHQVDPKGIRKA